MKAVFVQGMASGDECLERRNVIAVLEADLTDMTIHAVDNQGSDRESRAGFMALLDEYDYDYTQPVRGQILEGIVMQVDLDNEVIVDVGLKRDAFVPREDLERLDEQTLDTLVPGAVVMVYVMRPRGRDGCLIVSINKGLQAADWERADQMLEDGTVVEAPVTGYNRGGLLVAFGRLSGFVPQSHVVDLPRSAAGEDLRSRKAAMIGQTLTLEVIELNRRRNRLVLSERKAHRATQKARLEQLRVGDILTGTVVNLVSFGAFVDIGGIDGLIHISKLDRRYVDKPSDVLSVGDEVTVRVDGVDVERQRINLNRAVMLPDPWDEIDKHCAVGDLVVGTVVKVVDYGIFMALPDGLEGLLHVSQMTGCDVETPQEVATKDDRLLVRVVDVDRAQQRISLSLDAVTAAERDTWLEAQQAGPPAADA
jgi:small subunit ribosomal protein S1